MKKQNLIKLLTLPILFILLLISTTGYSQTKLPSNNDFEINPTKVRIANQIFVEHSTQKKVISEQEALINQLESTIDLTEQKTIQLEGKVTEKEKEVKIINGIATHEKTVLENQVVFQKQTKNKYKLISIILGVAVVGLIIK